MNLHVYCPKPSYTGKSLYPRSHSDSFQNQDRADPAALSAEPLQFMDSFLFPSSSSNIVNQGESLLPCQHLLAEQ